MSFLGRGFSITWSLTKIVIAGSCGVVATMGILAGLGALNADLQATQLPAGILGGTLSGYWWGKVFGRIGYQKHKNNMRSIGVDVLD